MKWIGVGFANGFPIKIKHVENDNLTIDIYILNKHLPGCDYVHLGHRTVVAVTAINITVFFSNEV